MFRAAWLSSWLVMAWVAGIAFAVAVWLIQPVIVDGVAWLAQAING